MQCDGKRSPVAEGEQPLLPVVIMGKVGAQEDLHFFRQNFAAEKDIDMCARVFSFPTGCIREKAVS